MSGGHWDYGSRRIEEVMEAICGDEIVQKRWPEIGRLFENVCPELAQCEHEMDWDISGDAGIDDDRAWERARIGAILVAVMKSVPDEWFPRGKWATIQAVQGRIEEPPKSGIEK